MMASANLATIFFLLAFAGRSHCQYPLQACCDQKLMDSTGQVAIETGRALTPGTYRALRVRFCNMETVLIQLWTLLNDNTVQFKWQTTFTPNNVQNRKNFTLVPFSDPVTVTANDRLGVYGIVQTSSWNKISIPYDEDEFNSSMQFTQTKYSSSAAFSTGLQTQLDSEIMQRTFRSYVLLCTASDCSDWPTVTPPNQGSPTECGCPTTCAPDPVFEGNITTQERLIQNLISQVALLASSVRNLQSGEIQTGYCPPTTNPGVYGIGSCYVVVRQQVQLVQASLLCRQNWNASLVQIESNIEQTFLYNILTNTTEGAAVNQVQTFWTGGLFSQAQRQWVWAKTDWTPKSAIAQNSYQNWRGNAVPIPSNDDDVCLVLVVDPVATTVQWNMASCFAPLNYYICEIPKVCF